MAKLELTASYCISCGHFDFCQVNWGTDCKRQGGKKIPRLKSIAVDTRQIIPKTVSKNMEKKLTEMFEPIRTKAVYW
jgi:hypothetical protein